MGLPGFEPGPDPPQGPILTKLYYSPKIMGFADCAYKFSQIPKRRLDYRYKNIQNPFTNKPNSNCSQYYPHDS